MSIVWVAKILAAAKSIFSAPGVFAYKYDFPSDVAIAYFIILWPLSE
jgi:hypothetical protein